MPESDANRLNTNIPKPYGPKGYVYVPIEQTVSFDCCICDLKFETESLLNEHVDDAHAAKKCKKCSRVFGNYRALTGHFKFKHPAGKEEQRRIVYRCKDCDKTFDRFYSLNRHQKIHLLSKEKSNDRHSTSDSHKNNKNM